MPRTKTWLLIVDTTLRSQAGHSYNYDVAVAAAARDVFDQVAIYGDRGFRSPGNLRILPIPTNAAFKALYTVAAWLFRPRRAASDPIRGLESVQVARAGRRRIPGPVLRLWNRLLLREFAVALARILRACKAAAGDDLHVFIPNDLEREIAAIDLYATWIRRLVKPTTTVHIVLRHGPEMLLWRDDTEETLQARLKRMSSMSALRIRFYTDSKPLQHVYREFLGNDSDVKLLPIPVSIGEAGRRQRERDAVSGEIRLSLLGPPRIEKGFGQLHELLGSLPSHLAGLRVRLAIQIARDTSDPRILEAIAILDRRVAQASDRLPVLELLEGPAPADRYFSWFASTDILVAPYIDSRYAASTSGLFVEALHFCVPTVTLRGTWIAAQIESAAAQGWKIGEVAHQIGDMADAAGLIAKDLTRYRRDTSTFLNVWREFNSAERLARILRDTEA